MIEWTIKWNFSKEVYQPGELATVSFWLENTGDVELFLSALEMQFDFGTYNLDTVGGMIAPNTEGFLGTVSLELPNDIVGTQYFTFEYDIDELRDDYCVHLGRYPARQRHYINVYPAPFYKAFVSRGLSTQDRVVGDPIAEMVREWGFDTITVGIELQVPNGDVIEAVKNEIRDSHGVIAIATTRHLDELTGLWKTLEWLHGEVGIAFGIDKPLLVLKDKRVRLGGLPSYLNSEGYIPLIEFDRHNLELLKVALSTVMPEFRLSIKSRRMQELLRSIGNLATLGLAAVGAAHILSGFTGSVSETTEPRIGF